MTLDNMRIAVRGLLANRLRSALTMLGIFIGVGSVIVLVAVGNGSAIAVQHQLDVLGTNSLTVSRNSVGPGGANGTTRNGTLSQRLDLTTTDVKALQRRELLPDIVDVAPIVNAVATATRGASSVTPEVFIGTTPSYAIIRNYKFSAGGFFTDRDELQHRKVAVIGTRIAEVLFGTGSSPVGQRFRLDNATFTIAGILTQGGAEGLQDQNDLVIAPFTAVQDTFTGNTGFVDAIALDAASRQRTDAAQTEIETTLATDHKITADNVTTVYKILNQTKLLTASNASSKVFTVLLGAVAAISLLVGGIGVMNIMLVTVTERTREIGIRKAIGASRVDVLGQFLVEAILLSVLGGILGVIGGLAGSRYTIIGIHPVVQPSAVVAALAVAVLVGVFFGLYPANRAAALRPIDALRHE